MPSDPDGAGSALKRLGVALLNATLLLLVAALVLAVVLVAQLRGLANDTRTASQARMVELETRLTETQATARQALETLEALEDRRPPAAPGAIRPAPAVAEAADDLQAVERALMALVSELAALRIAPLDADALERADDGLMRWLVLVILRTAARGLLEAEGAP